MRSRNVSGGLGYQLSAENFPQNHTLQPDTPDGNWGNAEQYYLSPDPESIRQLPPRRTPRLKKAHKRHPRERGGNQMQ